jgi:peptidoglycan/xylan/chitin deacetylase (PgdA/CDA1 family)
MRYYFRRRVLVVMYHGITKNNYQPPVWTQLPSHVFEKQIQWLSDNFHPVTLSDVIMAIKKDAELPDNSVLITFDDGLINNYTVAFPILQKYRVPACIFLTVDFIETERFFWVDELYMALVSSYEKNQSLFLRHDKADSLLCKGKIWDAYLNMAEFLKRVSENDRITRMCGILGQVSIDRRKYQGDFGLLTWHNIRKMEQSGLVEFGVHTANHRILTSIPDDELGYEVSGAKRHLEKQLGHSVTAFCYPNGGFGKDYLLKHRVLLRDAGYECAFSTDRGLFSYDIDHPFSIPRVAAGNDLTSNESYFSFNASGGAEIPHYKLRQLLITE